MKKIIALALSSLLISMSLPVGMAEAIEDVGGIRTEHIQLSKKLEKKSPTNIVSASATEINIAPYNVMEVSFAQNFNGKTAKIGDSIVFILKNDLLTKEGTRVIPASTKIVSEISNIERPKSFNRSGKIYLNFKRIELPNGTQKEIRARIFNKNDFLSRGKLNAIGKGLGTTLGGMAVGTGAGCGIGIAAGAVIVGGFAIGMPIGFAIGATAGLVTPGLHYRAKSGDTVNIQFTDNVVIDM